jgi:hypothetical protein
MILKRRSLEDRRREIINNPEKHKHSYTELIACCAHEGAINSMLMQAHEGYLGSNGGVNCDVVNGPCKCGAWHEPSPVA